MAPADPGNAPRAGPPSARALRGLAVLLALSAAHALTAAPTVRAEEPATVPMPALPPVVVVDTTPVPALGTPVDDLRGAGGGLTAKVAGHTLLNLSVRYEPVKHLEIWGRVDNATNGSYATAGALNWNAFADPISVERFVAPGAPIGGWAGVNLRF